MTWGNQSISIRQWGLVGLYTESGAVGIGERVACYKADKRRVDECDGGPCEHSLPYKTFTSGLRKMSLTFCPK
jgi:hypothetical protein